MLEIPVCPPAGVELSNTEAHWETLAGKTALELAASDGSWAILTKLLDFKADVNTVFTGRRSTRPESPY